MDTEIDFINRQREIEIPEDDDCTFAQWLDENPGGTYQDYWQELEETYEICMADRREKTWRY